MVKWVTESVCVVTGLIYTMRKDLLASIQRRKVNLMGGLFFLCMSTLGAIKTIGGAISENNYWRLLALLVDGFVFIMAYSILTDLDDTNTAPKGNSESVSH